MADKIFLNARYAFRSDTFNNWQNSNPILEKGEPAVVTDGIDGEWLKIGDGVTPFNSLEWKKGPKGEQGLQGIKGDKGEKGERGADGKDGKGAVIDQVYSSTSENAQSGKAVAEAVKEKWVEIADLILEEDSVVSITTDTSGEAFSLKKFRILVFHEAKEGETEGQALWLSVTTETNNNYMLASQTVVYSIGTQSTHRLDGELLYNWNIIGFGMSGFNENAIFGNYFYRTLPYGCRPELKKQRTPITKIRLNYGISKPLNAGSKIKIWGVRA